MTKRSPIRTALGPLEDYASHFDDLFGARPQRHAFRRLDLTPDGGQTRGGSAKERDTRNRRQRSDGT